MAESPTIIEAILKAIRERNADSLPVLENFSWDEKLGLRDAFKTKTLSEEDRKLLVEWAWHSNPAVGKSVRALVLLGHPEAILDCLQRFATSPDLSPPFELSLNFSEQEFHLDLPNTPGRCVSYYARDDEETAKLLAVLERAYKKMHPDRIVPGFRSQS